MLFKLQHLELWEGSLHPAGVRQGCQCLPGGPAHLGPFSSHLQLSSKTPRYSSESDGFCPFLGADTVNSSQRFLKLGGVQCCFSCCLEHSAAANSLLFLSGDVIEVYYGDNRFGTMTDSGTATLKPRPRVRPLLTFLPLVSIRLAAGIHYGGVCNWCPEPAGLAAALILYLRGKNK